MAFLNWEDYVICVVTLVFSLGVGLFYSLRRSEKQKTTHEFIMGDGKMAVIPVAVSLMVTLISGITMFGVPAEVYMYGMQMFIGTTAIFFSNLLNMHLLLPAQKKLRITSVNQYLELRYNSHGLRLFSSILRLISQVNYLGNVAFVPAVTLEIVAGIPVWISIVILMGVVVIYTVIGGFKAVIWTDMFQAILMVGGMVAIIIKGTIETGGAASTWKIVSDKGRINMLNFDPDPTARQSFWSLTVGCLIYGFGTQFRQSIFQRIKATPNVSTAKRMFFLASVLALMVNGLAFIAGAVIFAYYHAQGCDPLVSKQVTNPNQLMAKMVTDIFQDTPCLPGLFLASVFSASLSTMSSLLSASAAMFWEDIVKPHTKPMSERRALVIVQFAVLCFGGLGILVAIAVSGIKGPMSWILHVTESTFVGALTGIFVLGWFIPKANSLGGLIGGLVSVLFVGWISLGKLLSSGVRKHGQLAPASTVNCPLSNASWIANTTEYHHISADNIGNTTDPTLRVNQTNISVGPEGLDVLYSLSYVLLTPIGICLVLVFGSLFSHLQARKPVDPSLVVPVFDYLCCCIPQPIRQKLRCGVKYPEADGVVREGEDAGDPMIEMALTQETTNCVNTPTDRT